MADRSSAYLFGQVFKIVAEYVPAGVERELMVRRFWDLTQDYDFTDDQMDADAALMELGLARRGVNPDWPDDGEVLLYGPAD